MGQGPAPRYLCPREQVFQPPAFAFFFTAMGPAPSAQLDVEMVVVARSCAPLKTHEARIGAKAIGQMRFQQHASRASVAFEPA